MRARRCGWAVAGLCLLGAAAPGERRVVSARGAAVADPAFRPAIRTADVTYVSALDGRDRAGRYRPGDVRAQTRHALDNLRATLEAAGLSLGHVANINLYLSDIRLLDATNEIYTHAFPSDPPARTVLEARLPAPEALVALSAVAVHDRGSRRALRPEGWSSPPGPASYAIAAGGRLYFSLSDALDQPAFEAQTEYALQRQETLLAAAGMSFADLVFSRIYLSGASGYAGLNRAYERFVTAAPPARATVLARTADRRRLVGVQSVAVAGSGRDRPRGEGHTSPIHSYSVRVGDHLYITGMTGRRPDGGYALGDIRAQTRQSLETIREQLERHGFAFADVADSTVWLRDMRDFAGWSEAYREVLDGVPHAGTVVEIPPVSDEGLVEIMVTAVR